MKIVFSSLARRDLIVIGDYIAADSQRRARSFVLELREACMGLAGGPMHYPFLDGFENLGLRRKPVKNYLIVYSVTPYVVTIIRVLHAAQDMKSLLGGADTF